MMIWGRLGVPALSRRWSRAATRDKGSCEDVVGCEGAFMGSCRDIVGHRAQESAA